MKNISFVDFIAFLLLFLLLAGFFYFVSQIKINTHLPLAVVSYSDILAGW